MVDLLALPKESMTNTIRPSPPPFKHEHYGPESTPECQQKLSNREESSPLSALSTYPNPLALSPPPHGTLSPIWAKGIAFSSICPGCIAESPLFREKRKWFRKYFPVFMKYITGGAMWCSAARCGAVFGVDCSYCYYYSCDHSILKCHSISNWMLLILISKTCASSSY